MFRQLLAPELVFSKGGPRGTLRQESKKDRKLWASEMAQKLKSPVRKAWWSELGP